MAECAKDRRRRARLVDALVGADLLRPRGTAGGSGLRPHRMQIALDGRPARAQTSFRRADAWVLTLATTLPGPDRPVAELHSTYVAHPRPADPLHPTCSSGPPASRPPCCASSTATTAAPRTAWSSTAPDSWPTITLTASSSCCSSSATPPASRSPSKRSSAPPRGSHRRWAVQVDEPQPKRANRAAVGRPAVWTREKVLEALRAWARRHGRPPARSDWKAAGRGSLVGAAAHPEGRTVYRLFDSWGSALQAAGLQAPPPRPAAAPRRLGPGRRDRRRRRLGRALRQRAAAAGLEPGAGPPRRAARAGRGVRLRASPLPDRQSRPAAVRQLARRAGRRRITAPPRAA